MSKDEKLQWRKHARILVAKAHEKVYDKRNDFPRKGSQSLYYKLWRHLY